eukprot:CAMPEP_0206149668 /NCGR_PEP_ID=MMETSP1473-20131121/37903_1 /ASSEMBLY_ACC=CAM_ASM_001109 /TAXON_ID=1461547 /ORGANISM="Stichococcus sp, Strain RCC1054" /LENGTH=246 /DNA_ID=CAMNT_0053547147 /DNA_START=386 /DNA_END=1126 /DNA_ORIENTATION=+
MRSAAGVTGAKRIMQRASALQAVGRRLACLSNGAPLVASQRRLSRRGLSLIRCYQSGQYQSGPPPGQPYQPPQPRPTRFVDWAVYKGSAAMCVKVIWPTWSTPVSGGFQVKTREGTLLLEFAPNDKSSNTPATTTRRYLWDQKESFAMAITEMGTVLVEPQCSFMHDPAMGAEHQGSVVKSLSIAPMEKGGCFFNLSVRKRQEVVKMSVPLTSGELAVLRSLINYLIPKLIGFEDDVDVPLGSSTS